MLSLVDMPMCMGVASIAHVLGAIKRDVGYQPLQSDVDVTP